MSEIKPVTRREAYWAAMSDGSITPPEPQTTEECYLAAMSGNYDGELPEPQTREQTFMKNAVEKMSEKGGIPAGMFDYTSKFECTIPDTVTKLKQTLFLNNAGLTKCNVPGTVTEIPNSCFANCPNLEELTLGEGVTTLAAYCIQSTGIKTITLPSTLRTTDMGCMASNEKLEKVYFLSDSNTSVNAAMFSACNALADIYVPWSEGEVANAPWGATNATIHYNYTGE